MSRTPLNLVEQFILDLDQTREPWSVQCEVRVPGELDDERVAAATVAATAQHPLARARLAPVRQGGRQYFWEISERVADPPLEIVACPDDAALAQARARLLSHRVSLDSPPPFELILAHQPGGDSLIMNLHHAAGDGMSAYRLMTSICRAYAGLEDPVPDLDPLASRDLSKHVGARSVKDVLPRLRGLGERTMEGWTQGSVARVAPQGGQPDTGRYGISLMRLDHAQTAEVMARRRKPATVNDLLVASLGIAVRRFNDTRGVTPRRVSIMMPINLRPTEWSQEIVSNIVSFVSVSILASEQADLQTAQGKVAERTRSIKEHRHSGTMIDILAMTQVWPVGIRHLSARLGRRLADPMLDTIVLSNLGRLDAPLDFGHDAGTATQIWFSPPAQMPMGTGIGAATMNGQLFLTVRFCEAQFDSTGAQAFADTWRDVLLAG